MLVRVILVRLAQATLAVDEFDGLHQREDATDESIGFALDRDSTGPVTHRICAHRMLPWLVPTFGRRR
jgi:hypothetical protein